MSNPFNDWLKGRNLDSQNCFCIQTVEYTVLVKVYEGNLGLHRYAVAKGESILTDFSDNYEYSLAASHSFLKISCNLKYETHQ